MLATIKMHNTKEKIHLTNKCINFTKYFSLKNEQNVKKSRELKGERMVTWYLKSKCFIYDIELEGSKKKE